ncbi:zinc finger protein 40-like [Saccostrea echinata]|uniref:zinc finger protein 40-like n=1 Tax=Saccostrea echinata TaxID=191078 RepID=UPI002A7EDBA7|nr:zinc finger protein 40-like [Saccostrea echinata]
MFQMISVLGFEQTQEELSDDAVPPPPGSGKGDNFSTASTKIVKTPPVVPTVEAISQSEKRNLSLEALCEVGSSELENIQRQGSPNTPQTHESLSTPPPSTSSQESNSEASSSKIKVVNPEDIRKRKHPAKPGKHICSFCGRGCAKPSVLQKHLRAHTGERPFPCLDCGFAFKTKSNLYKHCKSRSHALKAKLGRKNLPKWPSQEEMETEDMDESEDDEEGLNESQSSTDTAERDESSLTPNEAEQISLLNDMSKFLKKADSDPTGSQAVQREDSFENREQAPVHVLQEVAKYLEKPKAERPRIEVPSWKSDARPRFETRMRNLNLEFEHAKNIGPLGKRPGVVDEQKLNSAQSQFITIAPKQDLLSATSSKGSESIDQLTTVHRMGSGGSVTVHRLLLPLAFQNVEASNVPSNHTTLSNVEAEKMIAIDNGAGAVEVIRLPHPNTDPGMANKVLRELEELSDRVQQSSASDVQLVPAVMELQDGTCQVSVKAIPAREAHGPLVRSFSQPAGDLQTRSQSDSKVDMEKVKERIQNLISSNAAIVKSPLFEYKRLYRQSSESKGTVTKPSTVLLQKFENSSIEKSVSAAETGVTTRAVLKPEGLDKPVSTCVPSLVNNETSRTSLEGKSEASTTRRLVRQSALSSSVDLDAKTQVSLGNQLPVLTISNEVLKQIAEANKSGTPKPDPKGAIRTQEIASKTVTALDHSGKEITIKLQLENPVQPKTVKQENEASDGQSKAIKDKIREVIKARDIPPVQKSKSETQISICEKDELGNTTPITLTESSKSATLKKEQFVCSFCKTAFYKKETLDLHMAYYCKFIKAHDSIDRSKVLQIFQKQESEKKPAEGLVKRQISLPVIQFPKQSSVPASKTNIMIRSEGGGVIKSPDTGMPKQLSIPAQFSRGVLNVPANASLTSSVEYLINKKGRPRLNERQPRNSLPSAQTLPHSPIPVSIYPLSQLSGVLPAQSLPQLQIALGGSQLKAAQEVSQTSVITSQKSTPSFTKAPLPVSYSVMTFSSQSTPKATGVDVQPIAIQNVMSVNRNFNPTESRKGQQEVIVKKQQSLSSAAASDLHSMIQVQIVGPVGSDLYWKELSGKTGSIQPAGIVKVCEPSQPNINVAQKQLETKLKDKHLIHSSSDSTEHSSPHVLNEDLKEKLKGKLLMKRSLSLDPKVLQSTISPVLFREDTEGSASKKIKLVSIQTPLKHEDLIPSAQSSSSDVILEPESKAWRIKTLSIPVVRAQPMYHLSQMVSHLMFKEKTSQSSETSDFPPEQNLAMLDSNKAISATASGSQVPEKSPTVSVPLILYGHNYPSLRMSTQVSFCCISRPQPMYVPFRSTKKISMYSNWKVSGHNTNPIGLTPKMLLSLYKSDSNKDPGYVTSSSQASKGGMLTHSSYWTYKEKKAMPIEKKLELKKEPDTAKPISSIKISTPKKVTGGVKSLDPYVYVRGRGRGKYICNECGIRCKKPSMLKKHIRSHTNLRPYVCCHCHFSFKTKGNLTKHMKSKSHHKRCIELGILPVPTQVDECQIDQEMLKAQCDLSRKARIVLKDGASMSLDLDEIDSESDDEEEEESQDQESMDVGDSPQEAPEVVTEMEITTEDGVTAEKEVTQEVNSPGSSLEGLERGLVGSTPVICSVVQPHPSIPQSLRNPGQPLVAIVHQKEEATSEYTTSNGQQIIHIVEDTSSQPASLGTIYGFPAGVSSVEESPSSSVVEITEVYISEGDPKLGFLFEELRKHEAVLKEGNEDSITPEDSCQKKPNEDGETSENSCVKESDKHTDKNEKTNLDSEVNDAEKPVESFSPEITTSVKENDLANTSGARVTREEKKNKVESPRQLEFSIPLGGFMPPLAYFKQPKQTTNSGPIIGQLIRQRPMTLQLSSPVKTPTSQATPLSQATPVFAPFQFQHPFMEKHDYQEVFNVHSSESVVKAEDSCIQSKISTIQDGEEKLKVLNINDQNEDNYSSYIIIENSDEDNVIHVTSAEGANEQVLYQCQFCDGLLEPEHILDHLKTHKMEHLFSCETCGVDFPSREKFENHSHGKSESVRSDSVKCDVCLLTFDSRDELSEHFKTETHIDKLEGLGMVPKGTFSNLERNIESLTTSDHSEFVQLLKNRIDNHRKASSPVEMVVDVKDVNTERSQSPAQFQGQSQYEKSRAASNDKVTVEIKHESNDFCQIRSSSPDYPPERGTSPNMPHLCEICRRGFINLDHLKAHLVSHAEIRPYVCEYCDAGFTNSQSLKTHLLSHAQERPYVCGYCGQTFPISSDLKKHTEVFHKTSLSVSRDKTAEVESNDVKNSMLTSSSVASVSLVTSQAGDQTRSSPKAKGNNSKTD